VSIPITPVHGDRPTIASPTGMSDFKELSAAAFSRTRMPMVLSDARQADCPIVLANQAFLDLTGYASEEVVGKNCRFLQGAGTSSTDVDKIRAAISEGVGVDVELLNYKKDGTAFWNQLHLSPILDDDGGLAYYFASQIDVSEFRKVQDLEAAEHRLLKEVDHRTKNALAIVESIVRLSASIDPQIYASSVQKRVHSIARAHELLSNNGWHPVDLAKIVEAQLDGARRSRIAASGPVVEIPVEFVQPLSLVIHELTANAVRHGSLSEEDGALDIAWQIEPQQGGFRLRWRESGRAGLKEVAASGFGTAISEALVEKQMGGTITRRWANEGLVVDIAIPSRRAGFSGNFWARGESKRT
jgi:PAS domain S-box-containing protein